MKNFLTLFIYIIKKREKLYKTWEDKKTWPSQSKWIHPNM
jgi:hypothetical protein